MPLTREQLRDLAVQQPADSTVRHAWLWIALHTNGTPSCWPSVERLAELMGCNETTVRRAIRKLERAGTIITAKRPGLTNVYTLADPPISEGGQSARSGNLPAGSKDLPIPLADQQAMEVVSSTSGGQSAGGANRPPSHDARSANPDPVVVRLTSQRIRAMWREHLGVQTLPPWAKARAAAGELPDGQRVTPGARDVTVSGAFSEAPRRLTAKERNERSREGRMRAIEQALRPKEQR